MDDPDLSVALSEAHLQAWKNLLRRDREDLAIISLQRSLEAAQAAMEQAPQSLRAREQVADRIKRLTRFQASQKSVSQSQ